MSARSLSVAVTAIAAAMVLTACGGGDGRPKDDKINGAEEGAEGPSASAPASHAAGRPEIKLKHFKADFEGWTNSDPKLQAILNDGKERLRAGYAAIIAGDPHDKNFAFYDVGQAARSGPRWVRDYKDLTLLGAVRAFDPQVHMSNEGFGVLSYCVDETKGYTRNLKNGKVETTPKGSKSKVQYRTRLDKNTHGVWETSAVESVRGGCRA
ncbi:hypothetical protein [Streptomyces sp. bgisy100]|uniref:hypothetical protein n=1 Tax=Streptomyces sp. bgisy100 TaxID=3413783 RepID=UPI003D7394FC